MAVAIISTLLTTSSSYHDAGIVLNLRSPPTLEFNIRDLSPVFGRTFKKILGVFMATGLPSNSSRELYRSKRDG